jgi:hypothetical protein
MKAETEDLPTEEIYPDACPPDEPPTPEMIESAANNSFVRYQEFWDSLPPNLPKPPHSPNDLTLVDSSGNSCEINLIRVPEETGSIRGIFIRKTKFLKSRGEKVRYHTGYSLYENHDQSGYEFRMWDQGEGGIESNTNSAVNGFLNITEELLSPHENKLNPKLQEDPTIEEYAKSL